jgi:BlaI family transcriptional regulator, penicillinase repressor
MARKKQPEQLTPLELDIMKVLWESAPATVQAVQERLARNRDLAYTTVQTMLNVLHTKGKVRRELKDRAYRYEPAVTRAEVVSSTMRDIIDRLFGGSAESLVLGLVETKHLTPRRLAKLQAAIDAKKERAGGERD